LSIFTILIYPTPSHLQARKRCHLTSMIPFFVQIHCVVFQLLIAPSIGVHPSFIASPISNCSTFSRNKYRLSYLSSLARLAYKDLQCSGFRCWWKGFECTTPPVSKIFGVGRQSRRYSWFPIQSPNPSPLQSNHECGGLPRYDRRGISTHSFMGLCPFSSTNNRVLHCL